MDYNDNTAQYINNYGVQYNRFRKRKRRPFKWVNSTGVSVSLVVQCFMTLTAIIEKELAISFVQYKVHFLANHHF